MSEMVDANRLDGLAALANSEAEQAQRAWDDALSHAIRAGEALRRAKELVPFGEWTRWVREHFRHGGEHTAQAYMRLASDPQRTAVAGSIRQALAALNARHGSLALRRLRSTAFAGVMHPRRLGPAKREPPSR